MLEPGTLVIINEVDETPAHNYYGERGIVISQFQGVVVVLLLNIEVNDTYLITEFNEEYLLRESDVI